VSLVLGRIARKKPIACHDDTTDGDGRRYEDYFFADRRIFRKIPSYSLKGSKPEPVGGDARTPAQGHQGAAQRQPLAIIDLN
jgi:hypothetical protein